MTSKSHPYAVAGIPVLHKPSPKPNKIEARYYGINPGIATLPAGYKKEPDCRPFEVATIFEQNIKIPLRDGTVLRGDVFRPANKADVPVILTFSPYGKSGTGFFDLHLIQGRAGIARGALSGFQSFEGLDPAEWVTSDYAVVNVDTRGALGSQGDIRFWGSSEGRDGYDTVEHLAQLPWCNGRVAIAGNSWLAISQWFIAAEKPPHLACILPLEGASDMYREQHCRGGVPNVAFSSLVTDILSGENETEDVTAMVQKYPLMNAYWEDKRARPDLIDVPAYVRASMSTGLHTVGSLRCFEEIPHGKKWLRLHSTQEWHDLYQPDTIADLKKFLDFYTKGIANDWEQTPKARISVIRYNQPPLDNLPFNTWPIPQTERKPLYLSSDTTLVPDRSGTKPARFSYDSSIIAQQVDADPEELSFVYTFSERTTLIGPSKAVLFMSCSDHDDLDVFVMIRKADKDGKVLRNINIPVADLNAVDSSIKTNDDVALVMALQYLGPQGVLRASHRALDPTLSKHDWPAHDHTREEKDPLGEVVRLEIGIWPAAVQFEAGEKMVVRVSGHDMRLAEFEPLRGKFVTGNRGRHYLHVGGEYASFVEVPVVKV